MDCTSHMPSTIGGSKFYFVGMTSSLPGFGFFESIKHISAGSSSDETDRVARLEERVSNQESMIKALQVPILSPMFFWSVSYGIPAFCTTTWGFMEHGLAFSGSFCALSGLV